jgi:pimeloyl-ACP methyl ester carboxylesterase/DNA-binding CsgD family transcriptional regulator
MEPSYNSDDVDAPGAGMRHWVQELSANMRFVRYDARGCGLSDREVTRYSLDAWVEDLEAVIESLGPDPVVLLALTQGAAIAIQYAALHPQRVSHLIIYGGYIRGGAKRSPDPARLKELQALRESIQVAWGPEVLSSSGYRRLFTSKFFPRASSEYLDELDAVLRRRWSDGSVPLGYALAGQDLDLSEQARRLVCPTLVFHARKSQQIRFEAGRELAAAIPGSRFVPVDSDNQMPLESDPEWPSIRDEVRAFLGLNQRGAALTPRQIEVLRLIGQGQTDKEIGRALGLSPRTVEMHVARALEALHCHTRAEAVRLAMQQGSLN